MQNWHTRLVEYSYGVVRITVDKEACTVQCTRTLHVFSLKARVFSHDGAKEG